MEDIQLLALVVLALGLGSRGFSAENVLPDELGPARRGAIHAIDRALEQESSGGDARTQAEQMRVATADAKELAQHNYVVHSMLMSASKESEKQPPEQALKTLRAALGEARSILVFQPVNEAPVPQGFPERTPVGEIRVQRYPNYRAARTAMIDNENAAFWTLFTHIKLNDIAMTAPVEMTFDRSEKDELRGNAMAFLYANTEVGKAGSAGKVSVADMPAATVVSIGVRGDMTKEAVAEAHSRLQEWLASHSQEYEASGDVRVFGYNSPLIPVEKRYFEVQLPVRQLSGR